jgi:ABC-type antimicrobial peptide transport system permease subunit
LGKRFSINEGDAGWKIIGVVNDVRDNTNEESPIPLFYTPFPFIDASFSITAQISGDPMLMVSAIKQAVRSVDQEAQITDIRTLDQILADSTAESRFQTTLVELLSVFGLILAMIEIYGVISYSVFQQTHEIGVRLTLGGQKRNILRMIPREGMLILLIGIVIGIGGALGLTRVLGSMPVEIEPTDSATLIGVAIFLTIASVAACYITEASSAS